MRNRLQKIIASAGIASRRGAERLILEGRVSVNDETVRQMGVLVDADRDEIRVNGKMVFPAGEKIYLILNKPKGYVTTTRDPQKRPVVTDLLSEVPDKLFPVGRLDYDSEGLLFMTNDGDFAQRIQHPRFMVPKTYRVKIGGRLKKKDIQALSEGIPLNDGEFHPRNFRVAKINEKSCWVTLTITEGRNRLIRRGFEALGYSVLRLIRISVADIQLGDMKVGTFRYMTRKEIRSITGSSK